MLARGEQFCRVRARCGSGEEHVDRPLGNLFDGLHAPIRSDYQQIPGEPVTAQPGVEFAQVARHHRLQHCVERSARHPRVLAEHRLHLAAQAERGLRPMRANDLRDLDFMRSVAHRP